MPQDGRTAMRRSALHDHHGQLDDHDRGLAFDLARLLGRRRMLALIAGAGLASLVACTDPPGSGTGPTRSGQAGPTGLTGTASDSCAALPAETAGPFPANGSNGLNVLNQAGIVRSDITTSFATAAGVAHGVPLTIELTILDTAKACAPYPGAAVYLWHCDGAGAYSLYSAQVVAQNYLRGVQVADSHGVVRFHSIFPGAYRGRWPHAHFEVYPSLTAATSVGDKLMISQLALPQAVCQEVYSTGGYQTSAANFAGSSIGADNVFRDGWQRQLASVSGSVGSGLVAALTVPV